MHSTVNTFKNYCILHCKLYFLKVGHALCHKIVQSLTDHSIGIKCGLGNHKIGNEWSIVEKSPGSFLFKIKSQFYKTFVRHFHKIPFLATGFDAKIVRTYQNQKYHIHFVTFFPCFCIFRCCHLAFMYCQKMGLKWPISFCDERSGISFHLFPKERDQTFLARLPFLVASAGRRGRNNMAENLRF